MTHRSDRTLDVRSLARVEGEGAMHVRVRDDAPGHRCPTPAGIVAQLAVVPHEVSGFGQNRS